VERVVPNALFGAVRGPTSSALGTTRSTIKRGLRHSFVQKREDQLLLGAKDRDHLFTAGSSPDSG